MIHDTTKAHKITMCLRDRIITLISKIITSMGTNTCGITGKCAFHAFRRILTNLFHCKTANNVYLLYSSNKAIYTKKKANKTANNVYLLYSSNKARYTKEKWMKISELKSSTIIVLKTCRKNADRKNCTNIVLSASGIKTVLQNGGTKVVQQIVVQ